MSDRWQAVAWLLGTGVLLVVCALTLRLDDSIRQFMPSGEEAELAELSRQLIDSGLARNMVLSVGGGASRVELAAELARALASHPEVAAVRSGISDEKLEALYALYYPRRVYFVSDRPEVEIPAIVAPDALALRARQLRTRLARPTASMTARLAAGDPLAIFDTIVERFRATRSSLSLRDGQFVSADDHAIVFVEIRDSPFDSERQGPLLEEIRTRFAELDIQHGGGHTLELSGVNRIALRTEQSMRGDIRLISTLSLLGVSALFLLFFRSPRSLGIAIFPPIAGVAFATACGIALASPLGGITVAFGVALIGVAIDYPIHVMNHHALAQQGGGARETVRRLRPSLLLGAATTIVAFLALRFTTFRGIGQMGVFAAVGIAAALVATLYALPALMGPHFVSRAPQRWLAEKLASTLERLSGSRGGLAVAPLLALAVAGGGLPRLQWDDDPASLTTVDPLLAAEDTRVRERVAEFDNGRFVIALAPDREAAIALNDRVWQRLETALERGDVEDVRSLHALLWSEPLQRRNLEALRAEPDLAGRIDAAFGSEGFQAGAFRDFEQQLAVDAPIPPPLRFEELESTPLAAVARSLLVELGDRYAAISYLRGVRNPEGLRALLADLEGAHYFDQQELLAEIFLGYRSATLDMVLLSGLLVLAVLWLRYRSLRLAVAAFFPSLLVCLATFGAFALMAIPVNLLGLMSLILVMGMGVDYGIFVVDSAHDPAALGATLVSVLLSCFTTVLVFGVLAISAHPALRSIGLTTGIGVLLAFVLAPSSLILTRARGRTA